MLHTNQGRRYYYHTVVQIRALRGWGKWYVVFSLSVKVTREALQRENSDTDVELLYLHACSALNAGEERSKTQVEMNFQAKHSSSLMMHMPLFALCCTIIAFFSAREISSPANTTIHSEISAHQQTPGTIHRVTATLTTIERLQSTRFAWQICYPISS